MNGIVYPGDAARIQREIDAKLAQEIHVYPGKVIGPEIITFEMTEELAERIAGVAATYDGHVTHGSLKGILDTLRQASAEFGAIRMNRYVETIRGKLTISTPKVDNDHR